MTLTKLITNWPKAITILVVSLLLFWATSCPPRVQSLLDKNKQVTRPELQIELDQITATAEYRLADLARQQAVRDLIFKNALLMVESGGLNPVGLLTGVAAIYGIATAGKQVKDKVVKEKNTA